MTTPAAPPDDAVAELEQRHRELCEFVSLVSHDLRTPLTAIRGYAQLLQRQTRDEAFAPLRANLTMIMQQADRLASYTELLLDVARLRTGRLALQLGAVDLGQVARAAAASLHPPAQVASEPTGGLVVDADAKRTHQIVQAMVTFAAERRGAGGVPQVQIATDADAAVVDVHVAGVELAPHETDGLFNRLVEISDDGQHRSLAHVPLVIAAGLAAAHGGSLDVQTITGPATRLRLRMPRARTAPAAQRHAAQP